ncbi:hypothetical protein A5885_002256 [Enterococcus sp. 8E11_MSG4843]|uniref:cation:proton antiporter n=1 Tax=Enterococcus sp. 8E11_MSG4843 TaxID=1834190 RepID=UPI000B742E23|nr:cation:proton antiporter [Enterococcus sp. 8E11_MSG4843]OUZ34525.1 hypothetical protein A5885_002256 [Enterococcus sp. 8E11_MSG4843]
MLFSVSLILLTGLLFNRIFAKLRIPGLIGTIIAGFLLGPSIFNLIHGSILAIADDLMEMALILVLTNAGLSMDIKDLKQIGRPAILMCFVPALFEILAAAIVGPIFLGLTFIESALLGCILAPVAAAVCVPYMIVMIKQGYGVKKKIPHIIIAGTSIDDVLVMVLFVTFLKIAQGGEVNVMEFAQIPLSILSGAIIGYLIGLLFVTLTVKIRLQETTKFILFLGLSFFLAGVETNAPAVPFSGLLALIIMGMVVYSKNNDLALTMNRSLDKIWSIVELFLFVLVGASIDLSIINLNMILAAFAVLFFCTILRYLGILISLQSTDMNAKEKLFCGIGYLPKTTVQAALGAVPLSYGLAGGQTILTVSVIAILVFAPLGSFLIEQTYRKLLTKDVDKEIE